MEESNTKDRILNAAERLFAEQGFRGAGIRAITQMAGVNAAAVNYHFGSKEQLLEAVIERRIVPINEERMALLEAVLLEAERQGIKPPMEPLVRALVAPTIRGLVQGGAELRFHVLAARMVTDPDPQLQAIFHKYMDRAILAFVSAFCGALPDLPMERVVMRLQFVIGAMLHTVHCLHGSHPVIRIIREFPEKLDVEAVTESLIRFLVRGMEGV
jgi:AcrR family transcriptional regulator